VWSAYVVPIALYGNPCPRSHVAVPPIKVQAAHHGGLTDTADYPPVARFHEGVAPNAPNTPLFGLKCANYWCYVLPAGVDTVPRTFANAHPTQRTWQVPGWQDFQHLGRLGPDGSALGIVPDWGFRAAVVADRTLGRRTLAEFKAAGQRNRWIHVATIHLDSAPPEGTKYQKEWRFRPGDNELYLRWEPGGWNGIMIVGNTGTPQDTVSMRVYRQDHHPHKVPGTAKWRWVDQDEEVWVRCEEGCCRVAPTNIAVY
jgi:hypothetical protein